MSQSLSKLLIHFIFSTKERFPFFVNDELRIELYKYIGGICNNMESNIITIGGYYEHIHLFCRFTKNISVSKFMMELKRDSSRWIKNKDVKFSKFGWQNGYGAFSIGESQSDALIKYINNQYDHHRTKTFQEEYREFLKKYNILYDERYVWD